MKKWLRHIRGAIGLGLAWAVGCTFVGMLGVVIFYTLFPNAPDIFDIWIPGFAYPGFFGGLIFSLVVRVAEGGRRLDELSVPKLAAWGAGTGLLVGLLPFVLGTPSAKFPLWLLVVGIIAYTTLLCSVSAVVSAWLFRQYTARRQPLVGVQTKG